MERQALGGVGPDQEGPCVLDSAGVYFKAIEESLMDEI